MRPISPCFSATSTAVLLAVEYLTKLCGDEIAIVIFSWQFTSVLLRSFDTMVGGQNEWDRKTPAWPVA